MILVYIVLAMVANLPAWLHGFTHELQNQGSDLTEEVWFLAVTPYSLIHFHNPFLTHYVNFPAGTNLMVNTTMFVPGVIGSPITFIFGPVAAFNVLMVVSIAGSATAAFAAFQRWAPWKPAAFAGGLLYGFSPYMVGAGRGHLFLLFMIFPPLLLLVLDNILVRQNGRPFRDGILLGLLTVGQLFTSTEVLASTAIVAGLGLVVLIVVRWRYVAQKFSYAIKGLLSGLGVFVLLGGYPIWLLLDGPQHFTGPAQQGLSIYSSDLFGSIVPTLDQIIGPNSWRDLGSRFVTGDLAENGTYLGVPLLLVLLFVLIRYRKNRIVLFSSGMLLISFVLSLGPRLSIDGHVYNVPLPFAILEHLPLLSSSLPSRFSAYVFLFPGVMIAVGLDRLYRSERIRSARVRVGLSAAVGVFALVLLIPSWPYDTVATVNPQFFTTNAVRTVPPGSVLLTYPFAFPRYSTAMMWQAEDGFRYAMPGGYVLVPAPNGTAAFILGSVTEALLQYAFYGQPLPALSKPMLCYVDNDLRYWKIGTIVVTNLGADPGAALKVFDLALGAKPRDVAGSQVFYDVQSLLDHQIPATDCVLTGTAP